MEYIISVTSGNFRQIVGIYDTKEEARTFGEKTFERVQPGEVVSLIKGNVNNGQIVGKYELIHAWF